MALKFFKRKPDRFDYSQTQLCKNCEHEFTGRFCNKCGEKVIEPAERSVLYFFESLLNAFTFLEGKFINSVKLIIVKPGQLSHNLINGIRVPYMKVVSLFFVANFFYFLIPIFEVFNTSFYSQYNTQPYNELVKLISDKKAAELNLTIHEFGEIFNTESESWAKLLLVIIVFIFSAALALMNRKKTTFYADHLTLSFEFMSFSVIYSTILLSFLIHSLILAGGVFGADLRWIVLQENLFLFPTLVFLTLYFLIRAQRNFYRNGWVGAILKSITLFGMFFITVQVYRFILFIVTIWSL